MNLSQVIAEAIQQGESQLTERELRDHRKLRKSMVEVLRWLQARKVGFLVHKPNYISLEYLPPELIEYLESEYSTGNEILIPFGWEVDVQHWKEKENRNFWHTVKTCFEKQKPQKPMNATHSSLGSPNTWERGKD